MGFATTITGATWATALVTALLVVVVLGVVVGVLGSRRGAAHRRALEEHVARARQETALLGERVAALSRRLERSAADPAGQTDYLITGVESQPGNRPHTGVGPGTGIGTGRGVPDRLVLSATVGTPLVKTAAFLHGLRRALSAQSRNRIRFEMRQEIRASRRRRRQAHKDSARQARADDRAGDAA